MPRRKSFPGKTNAAKLMKENQILSIVTCTQQHITPNEWLENHFREII